MRSHKEKKLIINTLNKAWSFNGDKTCHLISEISDLKSAVNLEVPFSRLSIIFILSIPFRAIVQISDMIQNKHH